MRLGLEEARGGSRPEATRAHQRWQWLCQCGWGGLQLESLGSSVAQRGSGATLTECLTLTEGRGVGHVSEV